MTHVRQGMASSNPLGRGECLARLQSVDVGRIAWSHDGAAAILPVNYLVHDGAVVFRTGQRSRLATEAVGTIVAFEVDQVDFGRLDGWSVVATGVCEAAPEAIGAGVTPWADGDKSDTLQIRPDSISGRRLEVA